MERQARKAGSNMYFIRQSVFACGFLAFFIGCATPTSAEGQAPSVQLSESEELATVYLNSWWASAQNVQVENGTGKLRAGVTFTRDEDSDPDPNSQRGGGVCLVAAWWGTTTCNPAAATPCPASPITGGYVYCAPHPTSDDYACFLRPGAGATFCYKNSYNNPGTVYSNYVDVSTVDYSTTSETTMKWISLACLAGSTGTGCQTNPSAQAYSYSNQTVSTTP